MHLQLAFPYWHRVVFGIKKQWSCEQLMRIVVRNLGKGESSKNSLIQQKRNSYTVFLFLLLNILLQKSIKEKLIQAALNGIIYVNKLEITSETL